MPKSKYCKVGLGVRFEHNPAAKPALGLDVNDIKQARSYFSALYAYELKGVVGDPTIVCESRTCEF
jgi:hypothetical protein